MFMTGPRSRHQRRRARDATYFYECMMTQQNRESIRTSTGYAYESFSKVYCDRVYFCAPSGLRQGQVFDPPAAPPPPRPNESRVPPPPPPPVRITSFWSGNPRSK